MKSEELAWKIRRHGIEMTHLSGGSHIGAVLSVADIIAVLYADVLKYNPEEPDWPGPRPDDPEQGTRRRGSVRGSCGMRIFPCRRIENTLSERKPPVRTRIPSPSGCGDVYRFSGTRPFRRGRYGIRPEKRRKIPESLRSPGGWRVRRRFRVEAALFANHFRLGNLTAIIDHNHMQSLDFCENTLELEDFGAKWKAFGWNVIEINGNDHEELRAAFRQASEPVKAPQMLCSTGRQSLSPIQLKGGA